MSTASSALTLALGAGGGLAAWYLLRDKIAPASPSETAPCPTKNGCSVRLDPSGLSADGTHVAITDAIERCKRAGSADVTVLAGAPAATYGELMIALGRAGIPTFAHRNGDGPRRGVPRAARGTDHAKRTSLPRNAESMSTFTLAVYPQRGGKRVRWFRADPSTTWEDARDRLAAAGLIDVYPSNPRLGNAWKLVTDPRVFRVDRAEPLPGGTRDAARSATYTLEGRTILRDGEAIIRLERVDLGDERYVLTPHATDVFAKRIVDLLNRSKHRQSDRSRRASGGDHGEP